MMIIVSIVAVTARAFAATPDPVPSKRSFNPIIGEYVLTTGPEDFRQAWCELSDVLNYGQLNAFEKMIVLQLRGRASYELIGEPEFECRPEWQRVSRGEIGKVETESITPVVSDLPPALHEAFVLDAEPDWFEVFCDATSALNHNNLDARTKAVVLQLRGRASFEMGDRDAIPRDCGAKGLVTETL
ncbi:MULTISPECIES: hypothetical protein [Hyphobacterium]|uniref:Uncharacterized protein n=1 Tax=Hyphobacterium vulgare TaxID=1736751 RepID=A0ABV6ZZT1_9PROT